MSISEQGMQAIRAYEHANSAARSAQTIAENLAINLMVFHLKREHKMSAYVIAREMGLKRKIVENILGKSV